MKKTTTTLLKMFVGTATLFAFLGNIKIFAEENSSTSKKGTGGISGVSCYFSGNSPIIATDIDILSNLYELQKKINRLDKVYKQKKINTQSYTTSKESLTEELEKILILEKELVKQRSDLYSEATEGVSNSIEFPDDVINRIKSKLQQNDKNKYISMDKIEKEYFETEYKYFKKHQKLNYEDKKLKEIQNKWNSHSLSRDEYIVLRLQRLIELEKEEK